MHLFWIVQLAFIRFSPLLFVVLLMLLPLFSFHVLLYFWIYLYFILLYFILTFCVVVDPPPSVQFHLLFLSLWILLLLFYLYLLFVLLWILLPVFGEFPLLVVDHGSEQLQTPDVQFLLLDPLWVWRHLPTYRRRDAANITQEHDERSRCSTTMSQTSTLVTFPCVADGIPMSNKQFNIMRAKTFNDLTVSQCCAHVVIFVWGIQVFI